MKRKKQLQWRVRAAVGTLLPLAVLSLAPALSRAETAADPASPAENAGFDQKLNAQLPLDLPFRDESGKEVRLGDYFGDRPVVLALVYYECPMLCNLVLNGLVRSLRAVDFEAGRDFEVVAVSFDPAETPELAAANKKSYLTQYGRSESAPGWHFLTGSPSSIAELTRTVGFRYTYDEEQDQYAHASGIMLSTSQGRLSRYFFGIEYPPRDLRFGLIEASENRIGSPVDQLLLLCYHYDPRTGKYGLVILNSLRIAGIATVVALAALMLVMIRRERKGLNA